MRLWLVVAFLALAALLRTAPALAHQTSLVSATLSVSGPFADLEINVRDVDLGEPVGGPPEVTPGRALVARSGERATRYVLARMTVHNGAAQCAASPGPSRVFDLEPTGFTLAMTARFRCARSIDTLVLHSDLFFDLDPQHRLMVELRGFGRSEATILRRESRTARLEGRVATSSAVSEFLLLGVEHIFVGYDHCAFLLALLLGASALGARDRLGPRGAAREVVALVTSFTVAHSITLALSALGVVRLPSRLVESAIAVSILWVAVDNARRADPPSNRWTLTFVFGLIHGLGFAGVLGELGLPRGASTAALLGFNLGVELGQLALVVVSLPALLLLAQTTDRVVDGARRAFALASLAAFGAALLGAALVTLAGVPGARAATVAAIVTSAAVALTARWGFDRGVRRRGALALAVLASLWLIERALDRPLFGGVLG